MPPPNITIDSSLNSNDYSVPAGTSTVTFYSTVPCTVCLQHSQTFGITSFNIAADVLVTLTLVTRLATTFEPVTIGSPCKLGRSKLPGLAVHTIGMDSLTVSKG